MESEAYSTAEVAQMIGVSTDTVMRAAKDGRIPHRRLTDKTIIFPKQALRLWLEMPEFLAVELLRRFEGGCCESVTEASASQILYALDSVTSTIERLRQQCIQALPSERLRVVK